MSLYDLRVIGAIQLAQIDPAGQVPPTKVAEANPLRRGLYLISYVSDFFVCSDSSPRGPNQCFRVPSNNGRVFVVGTPPITDTGQIYLYGNAAATIVFVAELNEVGVQ